MNIPAVLPEWPARKKTGLALYLVSSVLILMLLVGIGLVGVIVSHRHVLTGHLPNETIPYLRAFWRVYTIGMIGVAGLLNMGMGWYLHMRYEKQGERL